MADWNETTNLVLQQINAYTAQAENLLSTTISLIDSVRTTLTTGIDDILAVDLTVDVSGVDTTYVPPTAPTVPDASTVSISDLTWASIFDQAEAQLLRQSETEAYLAQSEATTTGLAVPALFAAGLNAEADQRAQDRISDLTRTSAIEHAKASREDIIKLVQENISNYQVKVSSEQVRVAYETLELDKNYKKSVAEAEFKLKKVEDSLQNAASSLIDSMHTYAQLVTAYLTGGHVDLGSRVSIDSNPVRYNTETDSVVLFTGNANETTGGI